MNHDLPYTDPRDPAPTINDLLQYLRQSNNDSYLYRGQTREYTGPLVPSIYRRFISTEPVYDPTSPEYRFCLRKIGRRFVGSNHLLAYQEFFDREMPMHDNNEIAIVHRLQNNLEFATRIVELGFEQALVASVPSQYLNQYRKRLDIWRQRMDIHHRIVIRNDSFLGAFGYLVGQTLAQQFGLSSEALDATTDIDVAAFFATHQFPSYIFVDSQTAQANRLEIGVIYRFTRVECDLVAHPTDIEQPLT